MKAILLGVAFLAIIAANIDAVIAGDRCTNPPATVYLLRHAEKIGDHGPLTAQGWVMASNLVVHLENENISAMYTTEILRSKQTAIPLANFMSLSAKEIRKNDRPTLIREICEENAGKTIVIVGHSDTIPRIVRDLGTVEQITGVEYCVLFEISFSDSNSPLLKTTGYCENPSRN